MTTATKASRPFYAVRVVLFHEDGSSTSRDFVRGGKRLSKSDFASFSVGDLIRLTGAQGATWTVNEITEGEVFSGF